jgi:prolyl-tRNA editing enzyme YbaK/EbsC (Cys-tRNA(Pro) deacylase)
MKEIEKIKTELLKYNIKPEIVVFDISTETSEKAAEALKCSLSQIAKSILFRGKKSGEPIMIVACGSNLIDSKKIKNLIGENIKIADIDFVKENTGYDVGGVAPIGHIKKFKIFLDEDLFEYDEIWPAAGTSNSMFKICPHKLKKISNGIIADVKKVRK